MLIKITCLTILAIGFPPIGVPALIAYVAVKVIDHGSRHGGIVTRRRLDTWSQSEPWVTGDEAADDAELARRAGGLS